MKYTIYNMKRYLFTCLMLLSWTLVTLAQNNNTTITGTITDEAGEPLIGVNIVLKDNAGLGTITDVNGNFRIKAKLYQTLIFTYIGYQKQEKVIKNTDPIKLTMKMEENNVLDEVTITGTGVQKKATVTGAITTVNINTLKNMGGAGSSISSALAGNVPGIIAMQSSGEPGTTTDFWIRGISTFGANDKALILVDGFERSMDDLNIEDIESFSILKDASATAIYGSKGANGVVLITTKRGQAGKVNINVKVEGSYNTRTRTPEFVDGVTYANLRNEAQLSRNLEPKYTANELEILRLGLDPDLYPNVDWKDVLLKDGAWTERTALDISGGGSTARYFISGSVVNEEGMYKTDSSLRKDYNTNSNLLRWNYRMNVDVDITKTTLLTVGLAGALEKQNAPGYSDKIWESIMGQNPIRIPLVYSDGKIPAYSDADSGSNPWVLATQTGYREKWTNLIQTNATLQQKLDFVLKGLKFIGRFGFDTNNYNENRRIKRPEQWIAQPRRDADGKLVMNRVSPEILMYTSANANGHRNENLEAELHYEHTFAEKHQVSGMMKYLQHQKIETVDIGDDVIKGIAYRNQGISGRFTYAYDYRYFAEFNFGYTGSENFKSGNQFGFFPAISVGWNIAEEKFIKKHFKWIDMFKFRYSYGEVGNDKINNTRFPYLYSFGDMNGYEFGYYTNSWKVDGYHYSQIASPDLTWEVAKKHNLGVDIALFNGDFSMTVDIYQDTREGIYLQRNYLSQIIGVGDAKPWANVGKMRSSGIDGNFMLHKKLNEVDLTVRGNMTLTKNEILEYDEESNAYPYKQQQGFRHEQSRGLIALGLFKDYDDIRNSPKQEFGDYMPGDIKYKDVNGDGVINDQDEVPIGATRTPNLIYGLGVSARWRNFDISVLFQGAGKSTYMVNGLVWAFSSGEWGNVSEDLANPANRWIPREISGTADTENPNAKYPRMSYGGNNNNYRNSSFWLRNGSYLRFKNLEIGYTFPQSFLRKLHMSNLRLYFLGKNLAVWDSLKLWDPELGSGNGAKYPLTKSYTLGLTVNF